MGTNCKVQVLQVLQVLHIPTAKCKLATYPSQWEILRLLLYGVGTELFWVEYQCFTIVADSVPMYRPQVYQCVPEESTRCTNVYQSQALCTRAEDQSTRCTNVYESIAPEHEVYQYVPKSNRAEHQSTRCTNVSRAPWIRGRKKGHCTPVKIFSVKISPFSGGTVEKIHSHFSPAEYLY